MDDKKIMSGAPESNAGDDFHLLWAGKKVLELLAYNTKLKAVCVEGPNITESSYIDPYGDELLAIDLAEYYSGEDFKTATEVVFSQLKYSTRRSTIPWTASKLCESSNATHSNSIIRRFSETYIKYKENYPNEVSSKLKIKLVSNRPVSLELSNAISECKNVIEVQPKILTKRLIYGITEEYKSEIEKIFKESKLGSADFIGFLKVLDFSDCDSYSRDIYKAEIIYQLGLWGIESVQNKYNSLMEYLRKQMMPESRNSPPINRKLALSFFYSIYDEMFPAPAHIPVMGEYIERDATKQLTSELLNFTIEPICFHASGGTGKTTLVSNIEKYLPEDSVSILYDCYGGGEYLQPAFPRHESYKAIIQICNEIALKCGTQFLFEKNLSDSDFLRQFLVRINLAIKYIKKLNPSAVLVIILDAVDNSFIAAQQNGQHSFVDALMHQPLPKDVRLLVTCRTENIEIVNLPHNTKYIEMFGFTLEESSRYLRRRYDEATEIECEEFHKLTFGNPRVQNYILNQSHTKISDIINTLLPNGKTLFDVFEYSVQHINQKYGNHNEDINLVCSTLILLPRPIPIELVLNISKCKRSLLESICSDFLLGIYIENEYVYFKDEDFEAFLRKKFSKDISTINLIADYMYQNRNMNVYCAMHVHEFLALTEDFNKLISLILDEKIREDLINKSQINKIMLTRIDAAFRINEIFESRNILTALKLIYSLLEYSKNDDAIKKLINDNPDLSSEYCDESTVYQIFSSPAKKEFSFDKLSKNAAVLSRFPTMKRQAQSFLDGSIGAINRFFSAPKEERRVTNYPSMKDLANIAECFIRTKDIETALRWLSSWTPYPLQSLYELVLTLLQRNEGDLVEKLQAENHFKVNQKITIIAAYLSCYSTPPDQLVNYCVKFFERIQIINIKSFNKNHLLSFFEYAASNPNIRVRINGIFRKFAVEYKTTFIPYIHGHKERKFDFKLRVYALSKVLDNQPVSAEDMWNDKELEERKWTENESEERKNENRRVYNFLLKAYEFRAQAIMDVLSLEELKSRFENCLSLLERTYFSTRESNSVGYVRLFSISIADAIIQSNKISDGDLIKLLPSISKHTRELYRDSEIALSRLFLKKECCHKLALELIDKNVRLREVYPMCSTEQMEMFISFAEVARNIDYNIGRYYFNMALQAANDVDYEAYDKLKLFSILADVGADGEVINNPKLAHDFAQIAEDSYRRLDDSDKFPLKTVCKTMVLLNPASVFGFACRIDDRDDRDNLGLRDTMSYLLPQLLEKRYIKPETAISLSTIFLPDDPDSYKKLVQKILHHINIKDSKNIMNKILEVITYDILYNVPMNYKESLSNIFLQWAEVNNIQSAESICKIKKQKEFLSHLPQHQSDYTYINKEDKQIKPVFNWEEYMISHPVSSTDELKDALRGINRKDQKTFLQKWLEYSNPSNCINQLEILLDIAFERYNGYYTEDIIKIIHESISTWSYNPLVKAWIKDIDVQHKVFEKNNENLLYGYEDIFFEYKKIFIINIDNLQEWLIKLFISIKNKEIYKIFALLNKLAETLESDKAILFLEWCMNRELQHVHKKSGDGMYSEVYNQNGEESETVSKYLWKVLGHPDKKFRWSAVHSVGRMVCLCKQEILLSMIKITEQVIDPAFIDIRNYFFYDSAKLWLYTAFERIMYDNPEAILPFYSYFKELAISQKVIHALHRRISKNIALYLAKLFNKEDIELLSVADDTKFEKISENRRYLRADYSHKKDFNFDFDFMDTLPYWYNHIGKIFEKSEEDIARDCEQYIEQFNINNSNVLEWEKIFCKNRYQGRNTRNDHGSLPEVELMDKYAEWHSMFYVADYYRGTLPMINDEDGYYTYNNWIDSFTISLSNIWISEVRDNVPYIPLFWTYEKMIDLVNSKKYKIPDGLAEKLIFDKEECKNVVVLNLSNRSVYDKSERRIRIKSVLIDKNYVNILINELQNAQNVLEDYYRTEDQYRRNSSINVMPTCIQYGNMKDDSIEKHDPFNKEMEGGLYSLSEQVIKHFGYEELDPLLYSLPSNKVKYPFGISYWSEPGYAGSYHKTRTYGDIAYVDKEGLLKLLKSTDQVLLLQCTITLEDEKYDFYGEKSERDKERSIITIDKDGNVETTVLNLNPDSYY